ncbi:MAG: amphi-Trp domain-containing protein [Thiomicrospira sp.]|uniref:amphi-Trp domain-containing protein n=1 Tax=Thiomicrospira sp. TaxID=935 RepID=UPI001A01C588|nr:amphi-Trp domain-containing protein [Thiomicrospira sp.]MBE0494707.1 amphi-Trp domain-containing protein [Thiomicrospira sp.]
MAKNTTSFKHESLLDKASVLSYLDLICQGIEKGQIHLANEEDDVTLQTNGLSRLKIKAKQAKSHQEIRITLAWLGENEQKAETDPTLEVAVKAPKPSKTSHSKKEKADKKAKNKVKSKQKSDAKAAKKAK